MHLACNVVRLNLKTFRIPNLWADDTEDSLLDSFNVLTEILRKCVVKHRHTILQDWSNSGTIKVNDITARNVSTL